MTKDKILENRKLLLENDMLMTPIHDTTPMETDKIKLQFAFIGKNIESPFYGRIIGGFEYENKLYQFDFHIHHPKQKHPELSNKMTNISEIVVNKYFGYEIVEYKDTTFGQRAFWSFVPLKELKTEHPDAYELRLLMKVITQYSHDNNFCKYFRKLDRQAVKVNPIWKD